MPKNLLFITWDSESSNYLENLFFPILSGLKQKGIITPFVIQYSWADSAELTRIQHLAINSGITYRHFPVYRKYILSLSAFYSLLNTEKAVLRFCAEHQIQVIMPRSTMPAFLVSKLFPSLKKKSISVFFDADGLPIQERVDYADLKPNSLQFKLLKAIESKMLKAADKVLVRTERAIDYHLANDPSLHPNKFFKVSNGRDRAMFGLNEPDCSLRKTIGIREKDIVLVHTGTLGDAYGRDQLIELISGLLALGIPIKLLLLTRDKTAAEAFVPNYLKSVVRIISPSFSQVPDYLSISDIGICFRTPAPSLLGIAPIKIGEYLLSGLPVLISSGIGDLEKNLGQYPFCFFVKDQLNTKEIASWIKNKWDRMKINQAGQYHFSLEKSINDYQLALSHILS